MKRQWKIAFAIICCVALLSTLLVACDINVWATFDPNYDGAQPIYVGTIFGSSVTPPTVKRDGYEFAGWYLDSACTEVATENDFVLFDYATFYAKWTKIEVTLVSISATYNGSNLEVGWAVHESQFTVTANYSDGSSKTVTDFTISTVDTSTVGQKTVTVSYEENNVTKTTEVTVTVVELVEDKTLVNISAVYTGGDVLVGQQPEESALVVTAYYDNDTQRVVTDFETDAIDTDTVGEKVWTVSYTENEVTKTTTVTINVVTNTVADIYIHFLELGNNSNGDCIYIKAGDTDILIDAGSTAGSAPTIQKYVNQYCKDGILEYVIVTHGDTDHIAAFTRSKNSGGGIFEMYECKTIIDFVRTGKNTSTLTEYFARRDEEVAAGANHYTALECYNNENGAQRVYQLADGITMEILYQKYYETSTSNENDYSVCVMFTQGDNHYLFLGDLEEAGEKSLVEMNPDLPKVELYKAGHHGSQTSASELLMAKIQPQYICICCVAGHTEYTQNLENTFPAQSFIDRIAPYTDNVYATTWGHIKLNSNGRWNSDGYESMNGNITFSCVNGVIEVHGSNNDTKLKDTQWFSEYRTMPEAWK
ncbi:MAG: MBL fold metallo-hydrolase [Clostridiales bacterium]|nr:MBL fold metallo-hydrolase [Clostridiales bacterium]